MALPSISRVTGTALPIHGADIDTDRIIPARFLKCVTFDDLAAGLFYDERFESNGDSKGHPLDAEQYAKASILVVGPNFGCGSSREHAPQSIYRSGYRAIIGESFAEIFFGNSTGIGMPCVSAAPDDRKRLAEAIEANPNTEVTLDLESMTVTFGDAVISVTLPEGARKALLGARWDSIQELLDNQEAIDATMASLPYVQA